MITRTTSVWGALLAATALSWGIGHGWMFGDPRNAGAAILAIAFLKIRLIILDFMDLRHAPRGLRAAGEAWAIGVGSTLIVLYRC